MHETSKATKRRKADPTLAPLFHGNVIDIGCGPDPLSPCDWPEITSVTTFDLEDGDANKMLDYHREGSFDLVYASQCLEHMDNPYVAFKQWLALVKPGGALLVTVPDYDHYEVVVDGKSTRNGDHKSTWSLWRKEAPTTLRHVFVRGLVISDTYFPLPASQYDVSISLQAEGYDYLIGKLVDQTLAGAEAFIEIVVRRKK